MAVVALWDARTLGGFELSSLVSTEMPWVFFFDDPEDWASLVVWL